MTRWASLGDLAQPVTWICYRWNLDVPVEMGGLRLPPVSAAPSPAQSQFFLLRDRPGVRFRLHLYRPSSADPLHRWFGPHDPARPRHSARASNLGALADKARARSLKPDFERRRSRTKAKPAIRALFSSAVARKCSNRQP